MTARICLELSGPELGELITALERRRQDAKATISDFTNRLKSPLPGEEEHAAAWRDTLASAEMTAAVMKALLAAIRKQWRGAMSGSYEEFLDGEEGRVFVCIYCGLESASDDECPYCWRSPDGVHRFVEEERE